MTPKAFASIAKQKLLVVSHSIQTSHLIHHPSRISWSVFLDLKDRIFHVQFNSEKHYQYRLNEMINQFDPELELHIDSESVINRIYYLDRNSEYIVDD